MDGQGVRKLGLAAPLTIVRSLCIALGVSLGLNLWQYGVIQGQRSFDTLSRAASAPAEIKQQPVDLKRASTKAEVDKRFDQLYKEIENLSRLNDRVLEAGQRSGVTPRTGDRLVEPARVP
jgi:hypothetical protein